MKQRGTVGNDSGGAIQFAIPGKKPGTLPTENSEEPKMLSLKEWSTWTGVAICIAYILMYLGVADYTVALFILLFISLFILYIISLIISPTSWKKSVKLIAQLFASGLIIFSFIFGFLFITVGFFPLLGSKFAKGMTKEKILSLKRGMSKDEIIAIIGNPIEIVEIENKNKYRFVYATPGIYGVGFEFDIWLINDKMDHLYIERDDFGVYHCDNYECPKIINQKALEELISYSRKEL